KKKGPSVVSDGNLLRKATVVCLTRQFVNLERKTLVKQEEVIHQSKRARTTTNGAREWRALRKCSIAKSSPCCDDSHIHYAPLLELTTNSNEPSRHSRAGETPRRTRSFVPVSQQDCLAFD